MRVEQQIFVEALPDDVWEIVTTPSVYQRFMEGLTRWETEGEQELGLGARYSMRLRVGSADVGGLIEIVEWDEPRDMAWTSLLGVDHRGRWRLRERDGGTLVTLRLSYQAPGGMLGAITDRVAAPIVSGNLERSLENLKRLIEGEPMASDDGGSGSLLRRPLTAVGQGVHSVRTLGRAGLLRPHRPDRMGRALMTMSRWGMTPAAGFIAGGARYPDNVCIVDELGQLTWGEVNDRSNRLANALSDRGIREGDGVAIMCRNHRYFIEATVAVSKLGATSLYMNTAFAAPQLTEVTEREKPKAIIYDQEFSALLEDAGHRRKRFIALEEPDAEKKKDDPTLEELISEGDPATPVPPAEEGRVTILTSGTTGTPKGASRKQPEGISPLVALLSRIPLHTRQKTHIAAPLFHAWGFAHFTLGMALGTTYILRRKFKPDDCLATIAQYQVEVCPMVPVMMQRILELEPEVRRRYDTSSLICVPVSGSALPGELACKFMDEFGDIVYNLYGSTEVAWATIATPEDLRAAPGTAGTAPRGTILRIYDEEGSQELPRGETGRIFVGNEMLFEGYTGGGSKDMIDGLMATGDVGRIDDQGRLFVEGRDDDMIVSGGENVFPQEVEDTLAKHEKVSEAAVIGVDDKDFGQRLKAFVVKKGEVSEDEIKKYVKSNLAGYKVPRDVEFIDELPRNSTGKVLKKELEQREGDEDGDGGNGGDGAKAEKKDEQKEKAGSEKS
jgi:acyl-CoA synthetase (AMP-forming)/AMP-acid ligase II/uncharacterized membrane protein